MNMPRIPGMTEDQQGIMERAYEDFEQRTYNGGEYAEESDDRKLYDYTYGQLQAAAGEGGRPQ